MIKWSIIWKINFSDDAAQFYRIVWCRLIYLINYIYPIICLFSKISNNKSHISYQSLVNIRIEKMCVIRLCADLLWFWLVFLTRTIDADFGLNQSEWSRKYLESLNSDRLIFIWSLMQWNSRSTGQWSGKTYQRSGTTVMADHQWRNIKLERLLGGKIVSVRH